MYTLNRPATGRNVPDRSPASVVRKVLLACGILAALLYAVAHDVLAATLYKGYSPLSQTVSELSSIGAPTRPAVTAVVLIYGALLIAFGIGVWQSARGKRALRVTGGLLIASGATGPLWLPFPITARGEIASATGIADIMHVILGAMTILFMLSIIGFGAAASGKRFRLYSIVTFATEAVFWALTSMYAPRVAAGEPTPWLGIVERIGLGVWLLWLAVLAITLLRGRPAHQAIPEAGVPDSVEPPATLGDGPAVGARQPREQNGTGSPLMTSSTARAAIKDRASAAVAVKDRKEVSP